MAAAETRWTDELRTFGDALRRTSHVFPAALFDGEPWAQVLRRGDSIPAVAAESFFGFEVRLGEPAPAADFMVTVVPDGKLAAYYARIAAESPQTPTAALVAGLAAARRPGSWANRRLHLQGPLLEYDLVERTPADVATGDAAPSGVFWPAADGVQLTPADADPLADFLAILGSWRESAAMAAALRQALERIRGIAGLSHVGVLAGRGVPGARLLLAIRPRERVATLLERLGWRGDTARAQALAEANGALSFDLSVSLDLMADGSVGPRIGLELFQEDLWQRTTYIHWLPLVEHLVAEGLCLPGKAQGLRQWHGTEPMFHSKGTAVIVRGINHLKVALDGDAVAAKGYLGMGATRRVNRPKRQFEAASA